MKKIIVGLLTMVYAGCVSVSEVVPVGKSKITGSSEMAEWVICMKKLGGS